MCCYMLNAGLVFSVKLFWNSNLGVLLNYIHIKLHNGSTKSFVTVIYIEYKKNQ